MLIRFHLLIPLFFATSTMAEPVSYNRDVRPILSENCFFCHGFDKEKREAGLRLDTREGALEMGAIVPEKPDESELVARIYSKDDDDHMPPVESAYRLTEKEKQTLVQWIKEGAVYEEHWAYQKLTRPTVPDGAAHPVDAFLHRTWKENQVDPVKKASPRELLRRLSYDLRGLAPSPEEVIAFENNPSESHYQQFVDRWLSSIEYAEHQGLLWLDLVRYADSNGMVSDEPIATGPYRRYVIEAFRNNMPFDEFTREQLAGDLLPNPTDRSLVASAYNRLVKTNAEAGVIEKEALYALKGEHVRALGTVWMGATTGCAECHDHKYDPITAKDYYSLAAFFDPLIEIGVYEPGDRRVPIHYLHQEAQDREREKTLSHEIDTVRQQLYTRPIPPEAREKWKADLLKQDAALRKRKKENADWVWFPTHLPVAHLTDGHFTQTPQGREVSGQGLLRHYAAETLRAGLYENPRGLFTHVQLDPENPPTWIALQTVNGAYRRIGWHRDYHITYYWGPERIEPPDVPFIDPKKFIHLGPLPEPGQMTRLEIPRAKLGKAKHNMQAMAWIQQGGHATWGDSGYITTPHRVFTNELAESAFRYFWELPLNRDDRKDLPTLLLTSLKMKPEQKRQIHHTIIEAAIREHLAPQEVRRLTELYREIFLLRQEALPTLVSKNRLIGPQKKTHVLKRGNFMDESGPRAHPAIPEVFGTLDNPQPTRLDLANWLTSADNPLTARVFVNRLWHQFYGRGLSETLEDSGNQGDWPSHPHLLNWLAAEFAADWNIRKMIRLLVSSDAYQLSSVPGSLLAQKDPTNRLHARQGRSRLSAEEIRDSALQAAGILQLTEDIPNQSFFPYQPQTYWEKSNKIMYGSRRQIWATSPDQDQYQRSLYIYWKRQNIHPAMLALDAPTRQECTAKRNITNTPAQALALLNDPQFVEAARGLAQRVMTSGNSPIDNLFRFALQRLPSEQEKAELKQLHTDLLAHFAQNPEDARSFLAIGQLHTKELPPPEMAAWTAVARIVLNLHEFLTRS